MTLRGDRGDYGLRGVDDGTFLSGCAEHGWEVDGFVEIDVAVEEEITRAFNNVGETSSLRPWARHGSFSKIEVVCTCNVGPGSWLGGKIGGEPGRIISNIGDSYVIDQINQLLVIDGSDSQVWLALVIRTTSVVVGNEQKTLILGFIDETPGLDGMVEDFFGFERQGHFSIITFTVHGASQGLKAFHHDDLQAIWSIQCHVG